MIKNPLKTLALAAGTLAFAASANAAFVTYDWGADDLQGWTVINGLANFDGDGIQDPDEPTEVSTVTAADGLFALTVPEIFDCPIRSRCASRDTPLSAWPSVETLTYP